MRIGDPTDLLLGGCGCDLPWFDREQCPECSARQAAWMALCHMAEVVAPTCLNMQLPGGEWGDARRHVPPGKVAVMRRAIELMEAALGQAYAANPSGPIGLVKRDEPS